MSIMKRRIQFPLTNTVMEEANMPSPQKTITTNTLRNPMNLIHKTRDNTTTTMTISLYCNPITHMDQIHIHLDLVFQASTLAINQAKIPVRRPLGDGKL